MCAWPLYSCSVYSKPTGCRLLAARLQIQATFDVPLHNNVTINEIFKVNMHRSLHREGRQRVHTPTIAAYVVACVALKRATLRKITIFIDCLTSDLQECDQMTIGKEITTINVADIEQYKVSGAPARQHNQHVQLEIAQIAFK